MDDFELEMRVTFLDEAAQLLEGAEASFLALAGGDTSAALLDEIFRLAHNFKGSARAVGFENLAKFAHTFEDGIAVIKTGKAPATAANCKILLSAVDCLRKYIEGLRADMSFVLDTSAIEKELGMLKRSAGAKEPVAPKTEPSIAPQAPSLTKSVESRPEASAPKSNESTVAASSSQNSSPAAPLKRKPSGGEDDAIRVPTRKLDHLLNLVGELVVNQTMMTDHRNNGTTASDHAIQILGYLEKMVKEVQDISMSLRMMPVKPLFQKMTRIVWDLSTAQGKEVEFVTEGEHVELDKIVLDKMGDPLTHLVRNAIDHGIEETMERAEAGKPTRALVRLEAVQKDDHVLLHLKDDGRGLNPQKLIKKAKEKGLIPMDASLPDEDAHALIFLPGFSTKEQVTDVSGRGVGMDVVKTGVEALKGSISIDTQLGKGTTFTISLPLSLSIIRGMVVGVDGRKYIIPVSQLVETVEYQKMKIETLQGKGKMVNLRGDVMPIYSLSQILKVCDSLSSQSNPSACHSATYKPGVVTSYLGKKISFEIDEIFGWQQVVLKKLGRELDSVPGIVAGAILSSGEPGLILNLHDFIEGNANAA